MRTWQSYQSNQFSGLISLPAQPAPVPSVLLLLHGVGSNEQGLCSLGEYLSEHHIIISLRAPLVLGPAAYGWFQVQFTTEGPVHNWPQASHSLQLLQQELSELISRYQIPAGNIAILGFSQGSIMTMGLALQAPISAGKYLCFSGRTLPQCAEYANQHPQVVQERKIFLTHGINDDKLPVKFAHSSKVLLQKLQAELTYHEFNGGHDINRQILAEAKVWLHQ